MSIPSLSSIKNNATDLARSAISQVLPSKKKEENKNDKNSNAYYPIEENWYKALPYAFKTNNGIIYLPISPQNISINTYFATNTITTLYSTVEEHSEVRYFDIVIQGTTGFSPKYIGTQSKQDPTKKPPDGRISYGSGAIIDTGILGGFGSSTINKINASLNKITDAIRLGENRPHESGVFKDRTGYMAFHKLYLFLLKYKKDTASGLFKEEANQKSPLIFINYKDNNQYSCTVQRFSLEKSADNPMLYNYIIQLRAYNLSSISTKAPAEELLNRLNQLGLDKEKASVLARARNTISNARSAVNSTVSAVSGAGR